MNPFEFHTGIHFAESVSTAGKTQYKGACPFCHKLDHFFFNSELMWDCKSCQLKGNIYTFLKHVHTDICNHELVNVLAMERGISYETMSRNGVRYNPRNNSFVIPTYNHKGSLNYLYKVVQIINKEGVPKRQILNTPSVEPTLFSWPAAPHNVIWLHEGLWDKMAGEDIVGPARNITCVGFPGSTFKQSWCNLFGGRELVILTDNDEAGTKILNTILQRLSQAPQKPSKTSIVRWPDLIKNDINFKGYDTNDILRDKGPAAFQYISDHIVEQENSQTATPSTTDIIPDPTCNTFEELCTSCKEIYHFTEDMRMLLHLLITCLYSLKIEGEQLWVRVIGPPGSSKTTIAKIAGASEQALMRSTFTGLLSGWKDDDPNDASLIPMIAGRALIVKDADAMLQLPNVKQILSQLRDFYDKFISASYLNRVSYEYENIRSAFILCGTHALRNMDNAALGERFLDFELKVTEEDRIAITSCAMQTAIDEATTGVSNEPAIAAKSKNLIDNNVLNYEGVATLHRDDRQAINVFGNVIAYLRAKVERTKSGEVAYTPLPEVPSRIIKQMVKLFQCAPIVIQKAEPDTSTYNLGKKITLDIIDTTSPRYKLAHFLTCSPKQSMGQLIEATQLHPRVVEREMDNMRELNMLIISKTWVGPGTAMRVASLRDSIQSQLQELNK
jgi:hypothetical protein